ncbi:MAG: MBL fold metallo-hydrolase [Candidatus Helarchaeota archaeon]|nr:MBL fold metallo-hydrolase [Candidatus Helarchaeota archaeon]
MPKLFRVCKNVYTLLPRRSTFWNANVNIIKAKENILIDTGSANDPAFNYLTKILSDLKIKTIDKIIITHSHTDHCQNLGLFADRFGAEVFAHKNAIPILKHERTIEGFEFWELFKEAYPRIHHSYLIRRLVAMGYNYFSRGEKRVDKITPLAEGDRIGDLEVLFVPGHSNDSIALLDKEKHCMFTGDMIPWTPYIHTSIDDFRNSIRKILDCAQHYEINTMIRGHQRPIEAKIEIENYRLFLEDMDIAEQRILRQLKLKGDLTARNMLPYVFMRTHFIHNLIYRVLMQTQLFWIFKYLQSLEEKHLIYSYKKEHKRWYSLNENRS